MNFFHFETLSWNDLIDEVVKIIISSYGIVVDKDLTLLEVNPLVLTDDEEIVILDCKMSVDDTAEFRQSVLFEMNPEDGESREKIAKQQGFSYVHLDKSRPSFTPESWLSSEPELKDLKVKLKLPKVIKKNLKKKKAIKKKLVKKKTIKRKLRQKKNNIK